MSAITVAFTRSGTTHTFDNVINVQWNNEYSGDLLTDLTTKIGHKVTRFDVNCLIKAYGDPSHNVAAQQALETALVAVGTGTLTYTGANSIDNVRFVGIEFEEYRGAPVMRATVRFITESPNLHGHTPVSIGGQDLTISEGFDLPEVEDSIEAQGPDEGLNNLRRRNISIKGRMVGTLSQANAAQANLIAAVENQSSVVVVISLASGGVSLTVRPIRLDFGSPQQRGSDAPRTYAFEGVTHDDYTKEPYTIGHVALTFGSGITIDMVSSMRHDVTTEHETGSYIVTDEKFTVNGTKYFSSWSAYSAFVDQFRPLPLGVHYYLPPNGYNLLELTDISVGELSRDGNFAADSSKRYAASVSLTFTWKKNISELNQDYLQTRLGFQWFKISSTSHSFTVDSTGTVTNRQVTLSGQIFDNVLATAKSVIGTAVALGDPTVPDGSANYYITSLSVNSTDIITQPGVTQSKVHTISVTATQLDTVTQRAHVLALLFNISQVGAGGAQMLFDKVTSFSKSVSNKWDQQRTKFRCTSITMTLTGEIWVQDSSGQPSQPNKGLDFFQLFDSTLEASLNNDVGGERVAALHTPGEYLPTNYEFFLNNLNFGDWQPFVKPNNPNKGASYWKQSITLSATAVFDLTGSGTNTQPDWITATNYLIGEQNTKFQELQVMGFGTVFKAVGINPGTAQTTVSKQFKDAATMQANPSEWAEGAEDPGYPPGWGFGNTNDSEITRDTYEVRGTTARWTKAWQATKEA